MRPVVVALLLAAPALAAQPARPTPVPQPARGYDVWVADVRRDADGPRLERLRRATDADGYHNQPTFTADGRALLLSAAAAPGAGAPPDIYRYDLKARRLTRLTTTPESEYSPAMVPGGAQFTVVRVERDSAQRLWRLDGDGFVVTPVLPMQRRVAYYAWADTNYMVLALLDSGGLALHVADAGTGQLTRVARDVGRSLQKVPGRATVSYVQRDAAAGAFALVELDPRSRRSSRLALLPKGGEHHAWLPDGTVLVGTPAGIQYGTPGATAVVWRTLAVPAGTPPLVVSRIAVSPKGDRVAFVAERR